jgi:hypothetical protein
MFSRGNRSEEELTFYGTDGEDVHYQTHDPNSARVESFGSRNNSS